MAGEVEATDSDTMSATHRRPGGRQVFLRIPPFPGAKLRHFVELPSDGGDLPCLEQEITRLRVGGTYWAAQPDLPDAYVLVRSTAALGAARKLLPGRPLVLWTDAVGPADLGPEVQVVTGECDPWHMVESAKALIAEPHDQLRLIAALLKIRCYEFDRADGSAELIQGDAAEFLSETLRETAFENPFTAAPMTALEAVELCGFWRRLIDSNRGITDAIGFAFWKQSHVAPLLWGGSKPLRFGRTTGDLNKDAPIAIWRAKAAPATIAELAHRKTPLIEVEDGFLRSRGLGADCVPPLSITVDRLGAHFDPSQPSELEQLIEKGDFDPALLDRACDLRRSIVAAGLGKYELGTATVERPGGMRRHILVPGQVEDDRAVQTGGCGLVLNLDLLKKVREQAPDAYILYKPHPDVVAGHRRGAIRDEMCLQYADQIVGELPIAALIDMVDEVHVNTSLAGFEALLRGRSVTTYGVPFYAGWGLTRDLGPPPSRRTAKRSIDELVAATLLLYPRYLDPVTGLPCPAEIVVARLSVCDETDPGMLVGMRRIQGMVMRRLRSLVQ